jgi:hypothetical protein
MHKFNILRFTEIKTQSFYLEMDSFACHVVTNMQRTAYVSYGMMARLLKKRRRGCECKSKLVQKGDKALISRWRKTFR